jgi:putative spermidine/putrescine transport system permease protein
LPGILAAFAIVYVISIGFFITPVLLGGITSPFTASLIALDLFNYFDVVGASVAGIMLITVAFLVLALVWRLVGSARLERALSR